MSYTDMIQLGADEYVGFTRGGRVPHVIKPHKFFGRVTLCGRVARTALRVDNPDVPWVEDTMCKFCRSRLDKR